jgi:hypothetical protein
MKVEIEFEDQYDLQDKVKALLGADALLPRAPRLRSSTRTNDSPGARCLRAARLISREVSRKRTSIWDEGRNPWAVLEYFMNTDRGTEAY